MWLNVTPGPYKGLYLNLTANHYNTASHSGDIVVNGTEIDFFNADACDGVGRYGWSLTGIRLTFTLIGTDPCGRVDRLSGATYTKE